MYPESTPNLLQTLTRPPWREEQHQDLHVTNTWERRIPFSTYVHPTTSTSTNSLQGQAAVYFKFEQLPRELQVHIISFCSACTLFQLGRVSSTIRTEACKLFWTQPDAYFIVEAQWLLEGGYPGYRCLDLAFLAKVQHIEVEYQASINNDICSRYADDAKIRQDRIQVFWDSIQRRFPQVKRLIINQSSAAGIWKGVEAVPWPLQLLMRACPPTIQLSASVPEKQSSSTSPSTGAWERSSYQIISTKITKVESTYRRKIILPARRYGGLVGEYEWLRNKCINMQLRQNSFWPSIIEALDRYHFDGGNHNSFSCPFPTCDGYFERAGDWSIHAAKSHYQYRSKFNSLPTTIRVVGEKHIQVGLKWDSEARTQFKQIKDEWNYASKARQREIEYTWIEALRAMPCHLEENVADGQLWRRFQEWASDIVEDS